MKLYFLSVWLQRYVRFPSQSAQQLMVPMAAWKLPATYGWSTDLLCSIMFLVIFIKKNHLINNHKFQSNLNKTFKEVEPCLSFAGASGSAPSSADCGFSAFQPHAGYFSSLLIFSHFFLNHILHTITALLESISSTTFHITYSTRWISQSTSLSCIPFPFFFIW